MKSIVIGSLTIHYDENSDAKTLWEVVEALEEEVDDHAEKIDELESEVKQSDEQIEELREEKRELADKIEEINKK